MELVEMQAMPSDKDISEKDADLLKNTGVKKKGELSFCHTNLSGQGEIRDTRWLSCIEVLLEQHTSAPQHPRYRFP